MQSILWILFCCVVLTFGFSQNDVDLPPSCTSKIYCQGDLLKTVQLAHIYPDSKTFVDMKLIYTVNETLKNYDEFIKKHGPNPSKTDVKQFVEENFEDGNELDEWTPPDWKENPRILDRIKDEKLRDWARDLNALWPTLGRIIKQDVKTNPEHYSIYPIPKGFIVPGGRFKEIYYWDTYWIVKGLLLCEMTETVRGELDNFLWLVKLLGHVPNGSRVYYEQRSQPPLLAAMMYEYVVATKRRDWLSDNIATLDLELDFWLQNRMVDVPDNSAIRGVRRMAHYSAPSAGPRPESYYEDVHTAKQNESIYIELKSAAESGWDFSYRWVVDSDGGNSGNLSNIQTRRILPVDLNAFLCGAFQSAADLHTMLNQTAQAKRWRDEATKLSEAIYSVMWNEEEGSWFDVDVQTGNQRKMFYPSNVTPLWANCVPPNATKSYFGDRMASYLLKNHITKFPGGIPTSMEHTNEQWDFPNAWPPLQAIVINGLEQSESENAKQLAKDLAEMWITSNLRGYREKKTMFEKYDSINPGSTGGGGEYEPQKGFGWTNGVILELINTYSDSLFGSGA